MTQILTIVLPIFVMIWLGYILRKHKLVREEWVHVLNSFVYYVSLPALILISFWEINWLDRQIYGILKFNFAAMLLFCGLLFAVLSLLKIRAKMKAALFLTAVAGNTVYMGFPLVGAAFGSANFAGVVAAATAHLVLGLVLSVVAVELWVVKSKKVKIYVNDFIKNPLIIALFLGIILSLVGVRGSVVDIIKRPIAMFGATASPVALFALGGFLHGRFMANHTKAALMATALKLLAFPALIIFLARFANLSGNDLGVSVAVSAMPTAVTGFVIAEQYGLDETFVANAILLSTAVSVLTISAFLYILLI